MAEPTRNELRRFGLALGTSVVLGFGLILPWLRHSPRPLSAFVVGAAAWALAALYPRALRPLHFASVRVGAALGAVQLRVALTLLYFLLWTPFGLVWRLFRRDPLDLRWDPEAESYRKTPRRRPPEPFERPY